MNLTLPDNYDELVAYLRKLVASSCPEEFFGESTPNYTNLLAVSAELLRLMKAGTFSGDNSYLGLHAKCFVEWCIERVRSENWGSSYLSDISGIRPHRLYVEIEVVEFSGRKYFKIECLEFKRNLKVFLSPYLLACKIDIVGGAAANLYILEDGKIIRVFDTVYDNRSGDNVCFSTTENGKTSLYDGILAVSYPIGVRMIVGTICFYNKEQLIRSLV